MFLCTQVFNGVQQCLCTQSHERNLLLIQQVDHVGLMAKQLLPDSIHNIVYQLGIDQYTLAVVLMQQVMLDLLRSERLCDAEALNLLDSRLTEIILHGHH